MYRILEGILLLNFCFQISRITTHETGINSNFTQKILYNFLKKIKSKKVSVLWVKVSVLCTINKYYYILQMYILLYTMISRHKMIHLYSVTYYLSHKENIII